MTQQFYFAKLAILLPTARAPDRDIKWRWREEDRWLNCRFEQIQTYGNTEIQHVFLEKLLDIVLQQLQTEENTGLKYIRSIFQVQDIRRPGVQDIRRPGDRLGKSLHHRSSGLPPPPPLPPSSPPPQSQSSDRAHGRGLGRTGWATVSPTGIWACSMSWK